MIKACELREVKVVYKKKVERAFRKQLRKHKRAIRKELIKTQKMGGDKIYITFACPDGIQWQDFRNEIAKYFINLGYEVDICSTKIIENGYYITLNW